MDYKITQEQVNKRICMNTIVNGFVAFMRENNFPKMSATRLEFNFDTPIMSMGHEVVLEIYCTEEKENDRPFFKWKLADLMGEIDEPFFDRNDNEWSVTRFDGGGYAQSDRTFYVAVDWHLYFITGEERRKYNF